MVYLVKGDWLGVVCVSLQAASVTGLLFVLASHFLFFRNKERHFVFLFFIVFSSGCRSTWWLVTFLIGVNQSLVCTLQAIGDEYFYEASWYWPLFFAIYLFTTNILEKEIKVFWPFHIIAWGLPAIMIIIGIHLNSYGMYNIWCRITKSSLQLVLHEGLLGIILIVQMYIFVHIVVKLFRIGRNAPVHSETVLATSKRLLLFLIVPAFCWSWGFVDRGVQIVDHNKSIAWIGTVHDITSSCEGFLNAIVYGWDPELLYNWKIFIKQKIYRAKKTLVTQQIKEPKAKTNISASSVLEYNYDSDVEQAVTDNPEESSKLLSD